jgi:hypothetical protein
MTCKFGAQTQDGSNYSSSRTTNSSIGATRRSLMFKEAEMKKVIKSKFGATMEAKHKNGKYYILTRLERLRQRD